MLVFSRTVEIEASHSIIIQPGTPDSFVAQLYLATI